MAPHSSTLAWKIPRAEEPGRLQSMGSRSVRYNWETSLSLFTFMHWRRKWQSTPVFLPGESQGRRGEPGGLPSMGLHRVGHDWSDLAAAAAWIWREEEGEGISIWKRFIVQNFRNKSQESAKRCGFWERETEVCGRLRHFPLDVFYCKHLWPCAFTAFTLGICLLLKTSKLKQQKNWEDVYINKEE